ncbi:hypothetical protein C8A03DRAFT_14619, partial [Achaetomium macrosporum]
CYTCGEKGHESKGCPKRECFNCGQTGHVKADCTYCKFCHTQGHPTNKCPTTICWLCKQIGHMKLNCPEQTCDFCGKLGHHELWCAERVVEGNPEVTYLTKNTPIFSKAHIKRWKQRQENSSQGGPNKKLTEAALLRLRAGGIETENIGGWDPDDQADTTRDNTGNGEGYGTDNENDTIWDNAGNVDGWDTGNQIGSFAWGGSIGGW